MSHEAEATGQAFAQPEFKRETPAVIIMKREE
jgi:hypothetical protein